VVERVGLEPPTAFDPTKPPLKPPLKLDLCIDVSIEEYFNFFKLLYLSIFNDLVRLCHCNGLVQPLLKIFLAPSLIVLLGTCM
jgi:hypothetical protein